MKGGKGRREGVCVCLGGMGAALGKSGGRLFLVEACAPPPPSALLSPEDKLAVGFAVEAGSRLGHPAGQGSIRC